MFPSVKGVQGRSKNICALKGSSVDLRCPAAYPTSSMKWYIVHWDGYKYVQNELSLDGNRVTYNTSEESHPTLTIHDLRESDANVYCYSENADCPTNCRSSGIELHVAGTVAAIYYLRLTLDHKFNFNTSSSSQTCR